MGCAIQVSVGGEMLDPVVAGRRRLGDSSALVGWDTIFLIASITKPIVCAAVVRLMEEGRLTLNDPATHFIPEFVSNGKDAVQVRQL